MPITHPLPPTGQNPWDATFYAWAGDVEAAVAALEGAIGGREVRHSSDGTYDYTGSAPAGTAESAAGWSVTRLTIGTPLVVGTGTGTWAGRAGIVYS